MGKVISVMIQKGGTGKTTTSSILIKSLVQSGYSVLGMDLDAQSNLTRHVFNLTNAGKDAVSQQFDETNIYTAFLEGSLVDHILNVEEGLDFIPSSDEVYDVESMFEERDDDKPTYLRDMIEEIKDDYDFIVIDTSPYLGGLEKAAIIASDYLLLPCIPDSQSVTEVEKFLENKYKNLKEIFNLDVEILGILLNQYSHKKTAHRDYRKKLMTDYKEYLLDKYVKNLVAVEKLMNHGFNDEEITSQAMEEYRTVLTEIGERLGVHLKIAETQEEKESLNAQLKRQLKEAAATKTE